MWGSMLDVAATRDPEARATAPTPGYAAHQGPTPLDDTTDRRDHDAGTAPLAMPTARRHAPTRPLAIVPAYNESGGVAGVVAHLLREGSDVVVIDDGSADNTSSLAHEAGAIVITLPTNLGIGGALQAGFRFARDRGYTAAFQCDADGQHSPDHVATLLEPLSRGADLVIGSRFADGSEDYAVSGVRRVVMRILARIITRISGVELSDVSSGFRAFGPRALELFAFDYPHEYMESVEALVIGARAGLRIEEVAVTMHERAWGEASANPFRAGGKTLRMLCSVLLLRLWPARRPPWAS